MDLVPLFPLPNVVLFPKAVLPLHIFEERYKTMTADVLASKGRRLAMALLRPGWEKNYHGRPGIEPVVCVGEIVTWELLPDGKYNFLLQGVMRGRVVREEFADPYRVAEIEAVEESAVMEMDLERERRRMGEIFEGKRLRGLPVARQFLELMGSTLRTAELADLIAFNLLEEMDFKQQLLADGDVKRRVGLINDALEDWAGRINPAMQGFPVDPGVN